MKAASSRILLWITLLGFSAIVIAGWDAYRSTGESYGYGTYTNWREGRSGTETVVAWINSGGYVVDYSVFNSSTGASIGGGSLAPTSFGTWHQSTFGFGGGNACNNIDVCPPQSQQ